MEKSIYKGVYKVKNNGKVNDLCWRANHKHKNSNWQIYKNTEIEAARAYDMRLISLGLQPVNILKPKL